MSIRLRGVSGVPLQLVPRSEVPPILKKRWAVVQDRGREPVRFLVGITGAHWQLIPSVFSPIPK